MNITVTTHPPLHELNDFLLGKLGDPREVEIAEHLETCPQCNVAAEGLEPLEDTLLADLAHSPTVGGYEDEAPLRQAMEFVKAGQTVAPRDDGEAACRSVPPEMLGEYRLLERIGGGGMGEVYKACHMRLQRIVALKLIRGDRRATIGGELLARFEREMAALGTLAHPNLIFAYDAGVSDGVPFLVMEHLSGLDLATISARHGPLRIADACELIRQAACGLEAAHKAGHVHRDVKPSNIMLGQVGSGGNDSGECRVKVLDFGMAMLHGPPPVAELTSTGQVMGTIDFMAPEQARGAHAVDYRADIYSLGATLFKLLTGRLPIAGASAAEKLASLMRDEPASLATLRPDLPASLTAFVRRMLDKTPAKRPSAAEVAKDLLPYCAGHRLAGLLQESAVLPNATKGTTSRRTGRFVLAILLATIPLALFGVAMRLLTAAGTLIVDFDDELGADGARIADLQFTVDQKPLETNLYLKEKGGRHWLEIKAEAGKRELCVTQPGFKLYCQSIVVKSFRSARVSVELVPDDPPPKVEIAEPKPLGDAGVAIQLLKSLDPDHHVVQGGFQRDDEGITIDPLSEIAIPWLPQSGYELKLTVVRLEGKNAIILGGTIGGTQFTALFDGWPNWGSHSGLWRLDGKPGAETCKVHGQQLVQNKKHKIICRVRDDRVFVSLDDRVIANEDGARRRLARPANIGVPGSFPLYFKTAEDGKFRITSAELTPLDGPAIPIPNVQRPATGSAAKEVLILGNWRIVGDVIEAPEKGKRGWILFGSSDFGDGDFTCEAMRADGEEGVGFIVGGRDLDNYNYVDFGSFANSVTSIYAMETGFRFRRIDQRPGTFPSGRWVSVRLRLRGDLIEGYLDDKLVVSGNDEYPTAGYIGLRTWSEPVRYRHLKFTAPDGKILWEGLPELPRSEALDSADFRAWMKGVVELSPTDQAVEVSRKLRELNPELKETFEPEIDAEGIWQINFDPGAAQNTRNLAPIRALSRLRMLNCNAIHGMSGNLKDLSPLAGMKLTGIGICHSQVEDLTPLMDMPLSYLYADGCLLLADLTPLKGTNINHLGLSGSKVTNLAPLKGLPLETLAVQGTGVSDLTPLRNAHLKILNCANTRIEDLTPVAGPKLEFLDCKGTRVTDLSPLKNTPIKELNCDFESRRDREILLSIPTLQTINRKPKEEFLKDDGP